MRPHKLHEYKGNGSLRYAFFSQTTEVITGSFVVVNKLCGVSVTFMINLRKRGLLEDSRLDINSILKPKSRSFLIKPQNSECIEETGTQAYANISNIRKPSEYMNFLYHRYTCEQYLNKDYSFISLPTSDLIYTFHFYAFLKTCYMIYI